MVAMLRCHMLPVPVILIWLHADNISILPVHGVPECDVCIAYIVSHPSHPHYELLLYIFYVCLLNSSTYWCDAIWQITFHTYVPAAYIFNGC